VAVPLVAAGFNVGAVALYAPFATIYAIMIHANLDWDFGPLRYMIASPTFHRWHHTKEAEGLNKNFSGGLPIWDLLFGTFYMPRGEKPARFGIDDDLPEGFIGQMLAPFGRRGAAGDRAVLPGLPR
jgi:sterol desaturase/sphingolipid hydroxylase (fatty acid hydroxylase superfamily)